jgi:hypothetical protein
MFNYKFNLHSGFLIDLYYFSFTDAERVIFTPA